MTFRETFVGIRLETKIQFNISTSTYYKTEPYLLLLNNFVLKILEIREAISS